MHLRFYKRGIPTHIINRLLLLLAVFLVSVVFFEITTNVSESVETTSIDSPTLPTITVNYLDDGSTILFGYTSEMDPCYMRDAIIPLDDSRNISLTVSCQDYDIKSMSYQLRSLDSLRNIASNDIDFDQSGDTATASLQAENLIDKNEEYLLILTLNDGSSDIYYYTRIMQTENCYENEILDFAQYFHNTALSSDPSALSTYIEPDSSASTSDLHHVTINSNLSQVGYGNFDGYQVGDTYVSLTDITSSYISLTLHYELALDKGKKTTYYNCSEDFRIRYSAERIYLLAYDRTMDQILTKDSIDISDNTVNIGIADSDIQYLSNETGTIVSFVQGGSLFQYDQTKRSLKQIFSFTDDPTDQRSIYNQHQILLLNIDESGTMDYVVYGYMNSGQHQGQCGINLYHYDAINDLSTEQVFISSTSSYQILNANFSDLLYETADNTFYIMVNGTLLQMKLGDLTTKELITGLDASQYAVSNSGRYLAWMDSALVSDTIHIMDLETGDSYDITAESGQLLKPLDFMDDDLIYGTVNQSDVSSDGAGTTVYPMYKLTIADIEGTQASDLMNYQKSGYYVADISISSYTIYLTRMTKNEDGIFVEAPEDTIKNSAGEQNKAITLSTSSDSTCGNQIILTMAALEENEKLGKVSYQIPDMVMANGTKDVTVATTENTLQYFVYVGSQVTLATDNLVEAISEADTNMGIVLDNKPEYVWKRGRKTSQSAITGIAYGSSDSDASSAAKALSAMLVHEGENLQVGTLLDSGQTPISILTSALKDYQVLDLTGASLDAVLYYVNLGNPVYAYTGDDTAVLIVGYDATSIQVYNPDSQDVSKMTIADASTYFEANGNVFVSYIN